MELSHHNGGSKIICALRPKNMSTQPYHTRALAFLASSCRALGSSGVPGLQGPSTSLLNLITSVMRTDTGPGCLQEGSQLMAERCFSTRNSAWPNPH